MPFTRTPRGIPDAAPARGGCLDVVNSLDRRRLYDAVPFTVPMPEHLGLLLDQLAAAVPVPPESIPPDLVTMHSVVRIVDARTGTFSSHKLVYPYEADTRPLGRSITAPFGAALFGRRVGEQFTWRTPQGERTGIVDGLTYQPERAGHFDE